VIEHLDGLGESAAIMRAVNCAVRRGNKYIGENTDGKGFLMSLEGIVDPSGKRIVLFGAGGAARAIGVELALAGAYSISVVNRTAERGMELVRVINDNTPAKAELISWQSKYKVQPGSLVSLELQYLDCFWRVRAGFGTIAQCATARKILFQRKQPQGHSLRG
jgi:shikimate dehydrogenase